MNLEQYERIFWGTSMFVAGYISPAWGHHAIPVTVGIVLGFIVYRVFK